jgi:hypothetical protein
MEQAYRFLPHKPKSTSLNSSTSSASSIDGVVKKIRDNTAATPPHHYQGVKPLSIRESIEIEHVQRQKMKELHEKQAVDRLAMKQKELGDTVQAAPTAQKKAETSFMGKYRLPAALIEDYDGEGDDSLSEDDDYEEA